MKKIQIPDKWLGEEIEGSMEKVLAEKKQEPEQPVQTNAPNLDGFEYVPSIGLYVSKQKELHNKDWNQIKAELHGRNDRMQTIYEFTEFIKHLRTKNTDEARDVLDEIYKVEGDWRSEWLDARFEKRGKLWKMHYHVFGDSGIEERTQDLTGVLMKDKTPGIDLDSWLEDNYYGLPKSSIKNEKLRYWHPRDRSVAGFDAGSGGAFLVCDGGPDGRDASLGVRAVRRHEKNLGGVKQ